MLNITCSDSSQSVRSCGLQANCTCTSPQAPAAAVLLAGIRSLLHICPRCPKDHQLHSHPHMASLENRSAGPVGAVAPPTQRSHTCCHCSHKSSNSCSSVYCNALKIQSFLPIVPSLFALQLSTSPAIVGTRLGRLERARPTTLAFGWCCWSDRL